MAGEHNTTFRENHVEADGFRIRYREAGDGPALLHLHGAGGGTHLTPAHHLLARNFRVIAFEMPGFGASAENTSTQNQAELARTMARAAEALRLARFNVWGTSFGGRTALWLAAQFPDRVEALVLEASAAIRPAGVQPPSGTPEQMAQLLYAHPERAPPIALPDPAIRARTRALVARLRGPDRDAELEARLPGLATPTLAVFGTRDRLMPPDLGRHYKELLPNCQFSMVYDAGHAIGAERPEAFAEIVSDFLVRREAFVISRGETVIHP
ncbi:MAG TPA: alpha/beta fold hydrolase [Stellaceae bacterium]|jgi:pimeloyl-ACP methyl ester carboxylesterase|nr:alpha/beta fold hydrolase [Stellaceae bacterium]